RSLLTTLTNSLSLTKPQRPQHQASELEEIRMKSAMVWVVPLLVAAAVGIAVSHTSTEGIINSKEGSLVSEAPNPEAEFQEQPRVEFIQPQDGEVVPQCITVEYRIIG